jgi:hypothetical protein
MHKEIKTNSFLALSAIFALALGFHLDARSQVNPAKCTNFVDADNRNECLRANYSPPSAQPWCPSVRAADILKIKRGQKVRVIGIDGCFMEFN